ncbi:class I SAM-dependent methyltransferase [Bradyrhizobium canariense]|uniref:Methyltransferase domain-containing protein n=1 Tax=Bradyrhizobium canariense TaxID=255045 RepID=A0A1H2BKF7_9BRAD|nr:class I SAM-dependent methyltransferase [Bradyrhizobium canariense]SDT58379.1 Methyltransferase domain-containing protein [Bradyrhizobium canariense]
MKEMYESDLYGEKNPTWHEEDSAWKAGHIERMIKRNKIPSDRICEVGCGTGEILLTLEKAFPTTSLSGYEISPEAFRRAAPKETPNTKFYLKDLLAESDLHFDVVLAIDVIEHVEDYISFIKKLKEFGTFKIFHIPLDLSAQSILRAWPIAELRRNVGHVQYFFKQTALATLEDCGYTIVDHCYTASRLELPNQAFSSRMMRLPRRLMFSLNADFAVRLLGGYSLLVLAK